MPDYLLLMHNDAMDGIGGDEAWGAYLGALRARGRLQGGSATRHGDKTACPIRTGQEIGKHLKSPPSAARQTRHQ